MLDRRLWRSLNIEQISKECSVFAGAIFYTGFNQVLSGNWRVICPHSALDERSPEVTRGHQVQLIHDIIYKIKRF